MGNGEKKLGKKPNQVVGTQSNKTEALIIVTVNCAASESNPVKKKLGKKPGGVVKQMKMIKKLLKNHGIFFCFF